MLSWTASQVGVSQAIAPRAESSVTVTIWRQESSTPSTFAPKWSMKRICTA